MKTSWNPILGKKFAPDVNCNSVIHEKTFHFDFKTGYSLQSAQQESYIKYFFKKKVETRIFRQYRHHKEWCITFRELLSQMCILEMGKQFPESLNIYRKAVSGWLFKLVIKTFPGTLEPYNQEVTVFLMPVAFFPSL